MNFSHIEYGRARSRGTSDTPSTSSRTSRSSHERSSSSCRTDFSAASSSGPRAADLFFDRGRSRSSSWSDDEPIFHLELSPPSLPSPDVPKAASSFTLPPFFSPNAMHVSAAHVLGRPYRLCAMGKLTTFEPKGFDAKANCAPEAIGLIEEFGTYHLGTRLVRQQLPRPILELNRTLRGAKSLALMLLFASGKVRAHDPKDTILSQVDAFVADVRLAQTPPQPIQQLPPPLPQFCDSKLI